MPHAPAKGTQIHPRSSHFGVYSDLTSADVAADPPVNVALCLYQGYVYISLCTCTIAIGTIQFNS